MHFIPLPPIYCGLGLCEGAATDQFLACDGRQSDCLLQQPVEKHPARARSAPVEPKRELVQVVIQVRRSDCSLVCAQQPSLEQGGDEVDPEQQVISQFDGWLDHFVVVSQNSQPAISRPIVGLNMSARFNGLPHGRLQTGRRSVLYSGQANPPNLSTVGLSRNQNQGLIGRATPPLTRPWPANEGFIDLDHPSQSISIRAHHGPPQLVHPVPGGSITAQTQNPLHAQSTGTR